MLRIKKEIELKKLEKFGIRKHKGDRDCVVASKWGREWIEADTIDGYACGSSGFEFYPVLEIYSDNTIACKGNRLYGLDGEANGLETLYKLIQAGYVENYTLTYDEKEDKFESFID